MSGIMSSKSFVILSAVLLSQAGLFYGFSRSERIPARNPLSDFTLTGGSWKVQQDIELSQDEKDVLQADDLLSRQYRNSSGQDAVLFVAFFDTQKTGKAPHSPKNCLPAAGWVPSQNEIVDVPVSGESVPLEVNRYVVSRGDNQSVVLYWYQSANRTVASEYWAKIYTVSDSIRYNRSDVAIVRIVVGVNGSDTKGAIKIASDLAALTYPQLKRYLPA